MIAPPVFVEREETTFYKYALKILGKLLPGFPLIPDMGIYFYNYMIIIYRSFY